MLEVNLQHTAVIVGMLAAKIPAVWLKDSRVSCGTPTTHCSYSRTLALAAKPLVCVNDSRVSCGTPTTHRSYTYSRTLVLAANPQFVSMTGALVTTALQCRLKVNVPVTMHKLC